MKLLFLFLSGLTCSAQYVAVTFGTAPTPTNLWTECVYQSTTNTRPPQVLFTVEDFNAYMATNMASFMAWKTNAANPQVKLDANIARLNELYAKIPAARSNFTFIQNAGLTNAATLSAAVKMEAQMLDGITEFIQRLGPVLKQLYKPEEDATQ